MSEIDDNRTKKNTQITKKNKLQQKNWKKYFKSKKGENGRHTFFFNFDHFLKN